MSWTLYRVKRGLRTRPIELFGVSVGGGRRRAVADQDIAIFHPISTVLPDLATKLRIFTFFTDTFYHVDSS